MPKESKELEKIAREYVNELKVNSVIVKKMLEQRGSNKGFFTSYASPIEKKLVAKVIVAMKHYAKGDPELLKHPTQLKSHCNGINFAMPVTIMTIPAGTELTQMQAAGKGVAETRQGNYYSLNKMHEFDQGDLTADAHLRGIADSIIVEGPEMKEGYKHYASEKAMTNFKTTQDVEVLHTTAGAIEDTWSMTAWVDNKPNRVGIDTKGGGEQVHINNEENLTIQPELREKWEKYVELLATNSLPASEKENARDVLNTYAMVLYDRASFNKNLIQPAVDALIYLQENFVGLDKPLCNEALEITRFAVDGAIKKHEKLTDSAEDVQKLNTKVSKVIEDRKASLSDEVKPIKPTRINMKK